MKQTVSYKDCKITKRGSDNYIGSWYVAPCGWGTYNRPDIDHMEWHKRLDQGRDPSKERR